jgi:hypothetical protein
MTTVTNATEYAECKSLKMKPLCKMPGRGHKSKTVDLCVSDNRGQGLRFRRLLLRLVGSNALDEIIL